MIMSKLLEAVLRPLAHYRSLHVGRSRQQSEMVSMCAQSNRTHAFVCVCAPPVADLRPKPAGQRNSRLKRDASKGSKTRQMKTTTMTTTTTMMMMKMTPQRDKPAEVQLLKSGTGLAAFLQDGTICHLIRHVP